MTVQSSSIIVKASASSAEGIGAHFKLIVDGNAVAETTVTATNPADYAFNVDLDRAVAHTIAVRYDNDIVNGNGDRNLYVQSIALNGTVIAASDPATRYVPDYGVQPRSGTGNMYWGGTLSVGFPAVAAAATPPTVVTVAPVVPVVPVVTTPVVTPTTPVVVPPASSSQPAGSVSVSVSGTSAGGVAPHFRLLLDGAVIGSGDVADGPAKTFTFAASINPAQTHLLRLSYDNDGVVNGVDRNLFVQSVTVNGQTYRPSDSIAVYHATGQGDVRGSGALYWGGNLDFSLPIVPATTTTVTPVASSPTVTPPVTVAPVTTVVTPPVTPAVTTPAFYVATYGSDGASGTAANPFATLDRARLAMEGSTIRTTYVLGGTYSPSSTLTLGAADSGMSFIAASGSTPLLNGQGRLSTLISLDGASGVTLEGLSFTGASGSGKGAVMLKNGGSNNIVANTFDANTNGIVLTGSSGNLVLNNAINHSSQSAVEAKDGSNGNTFTSNSIDGTGALAQSGGGFFLHGVNNNTITHNLVQNTAGVGIGIENWDGTTINVGNTVTYNVVRNTSTQSQDSGAIYILGRSHVDTKALVANNIVDGTGASGDGHTIGIYLDDSTTGVTVQNNIVRHIGTHGMEIHGGDNNVVRNNIFDLGSTGTSAILFQAAPADTNPTNTMLGNVVSANVILAGGVGQTAYTDLNGGRPSITGNLYTGLTAAQVTTGLIGDVRPSFGSAGFLDAANGNYTLSSGSAAASAIGFTPIDTSTIGVLALPAAWAR